MGSPGCGGESTARSVAVIVLAGIDGGAGREIGCGAYPGAVAVWVTCGERQGEATCCGGLIVGELTGSGGADGIGALYVAWTTFEGGCTTDG